MVGKEKMSVEGCDGAAVEMPSSNFEELQVGLGHKGP